MLGRPGQVACCLCGRAVQSDRMVEGMCADCTAANVDLAEGIETECEIEMCRTCGKWYRNPQWVALEPESAELLSLCLRRVRGLRKRHLVDASWIWTEPHSRRLKLRLAVEEDVGGGTSIRQAIVVEFTVRTRNCDGCNKAAAKDTWQAKVQLRQRAEHPRTLLALEQALLSHGSRGRGRALDSAIDVKHVAGGLDFLFRRQQHAARLATLISLLAPCRTKVSQTVVAANAKQGTSNVRHTWSVDLAPLCRGDLVLLPRHLACGVGPLALVSRVGASLHLIDPATARTAKLRSDAYWRHPFSPLASSRQLATFVVLDCEDAPPAGPKRDAPRRRHGKQRRAADEASGAQGCVPPAAEAEAEVAAWRPADATVAREDDFGAPLLVRTHLGGRIEAGDECVGYDLEAMAHLELDDALGGDAPPIVLVAKKTEHAPKASAVARRRRRRRHRDEGKAAPRGSRTSEDTDEAEGASEDEPLEDGEEMGDVSAFFAALVTDDSAPCGDDEGEGGDGGGDSAGGSAPAGAAPAAASDGSSS